MLVLYCSLSSHNIQYVYFSISRLQHSAPAVPSSFQAAPFSRQSLGPIGGGLGLSYNAYSQSMTQQGIPGAGGFPMGSTSQPSELSTVPGGGSGVGGVGNLDQQSGTAPVAVPTPIGPPPQSGSHALHQTGRNKCHLLLQRNCFSFIGICCFG